mgnify:FL=1
MLLSHWPFRRQQQRGIPFVRLTKEADYFADVLWCAQEGKRIFSSNKRTYPVMALSFSSSSLLSKQFSFEKLFEEEERDWRRHSSALWSKWSDWLIAKQILQHRLHRHRKRVESSNLVRVVIFAELLGGEQQRESRAKYFSRDESYGPK